MTILSLIGAATIAFLVVAAVGIAYLEAWIQPDRPTPREEGA